MGANPWRLEIVMEMLAGQKPFFLDGILWAILVGDIIEMMINEQ